MLEFKTVSKKMLKICRQMEKAAHTDVPILISGERGVGKAACARFIHNYSKRAGFPFIEASAEQINKQGLQNFIGAVQNGTLYIDEIADLTAGPQHSLHDSLSAKHAYRLISSSTPPLDMTVKRGVFLEELYYSLCVTKIRLLSLRERKEDIPLLIEAFIERYSEESGIQKTVDSAVVDILVARSWPGNIYELQSSIQYAFQRAEQGVIHERDLPAWSKANYYTSVTGESLHDELLRISGELIQAAAQMETFEAYEDYKKIVMPPLISASMALTNSNISHAAKLLGITRNTLKKMMGEYEIVRTQIRNSHGD